MDIRDTAGYFIDSVKEYAKHGRIAELTREIAEEQKKCGSCDKWMKDSCPLEKHMKVGMNRMKCGEFVLSGRSEQWINELQLRLYEIESN